MDGRPARVEAAALPALPGRAGACSGRRRSTPAWVGHGGVELVDAGLVAGADVEHQAAPPVGRPGEGVDDVVDEDEVPGLAAVAVDGARLAGQEPAGEDGHHSGLAVRVLAGPVHVGQGQGGELQVVQLPVGGQVVADDLLGHPVGRQRPLRM